MAITADEIRAALEADKKRIELLEATVARLRGVVRGMLLAVGMPKVEQKLHYGSPHFTFHHPHRHVEVALGALARDSELCLELKLIEQVEVRA